MFNKIKEFFLGKPPEPAPEAPYKIETPTPLTPAVVNPAVFPNLTVDGHDDVHEVKSNTRSKNTAEKKPATTKATAKPKTPRKPKAK